MVNWTHGIRVGSLQGMGEYPQTRCHLFRGGRELFGSARIPAGGWETFPTRGTFLLGRAVEDRPGIDDPVYPPGTEDSNNRVRGMAKVQEAL